MDTAQTWTLPGFEWPAAADATDEAALADVREHKAHVIFVSEQEAGPGLPFRPGFAFTIGLYLHFGHPELLIMGLPPEVCDDVLNEVIGLVEEGSAYGDGDESGDILRNLPVRFVGVPSEAYAEWLGYARWFYASIDQDSFPCVQILWPSKKGRFPGQKGCPPSLKRHQPVLGTARP